jgi:hypothetical protein
MEVSYPHYLDGQAQSRKLEALANMATINSLGRAGGGGTVWLAACPRGGPTSTPRALREYY